MRYEIKGSTLPILEMRLSQGEAIFTESGGMSWMDNNIHMETSGRGGIGGMIGRAFSGESLFMTTYTAQADDAFLVFAPEAPGNIVPIQLAAGQSIICQKDAFMCAEDDVNLETHFNKRLGAGFFGGEGFIMQKATGPGYVFLELPGEVIEYELAPGQRLKVDTGHVGAFEPTVDFDIERVKGFRNILLGGEGLFLTTLTGPGKIYLQTMTYPNFAAKLIPHLPLNNS